MGSRESSESEAEAMLSDDTMPPSCGGTAPEQLVTTFDKVRPTSSQGILGRMLNQGFWSRMST